MAVLNGEMRLTTGVLKKKVSKKGEVAPHELHPVLEPAILSYPDLC